MQLFANFGNLGVNEREAFLVELIGELVNATIPRDEGLFPQDLSISLVILEETISQMVCCS